MTIILFLLTFGHHHKKPAPPPEPPPAVKSHDPYKSECFHRIETGWNTPPEANCQART